MSRPTREIACSSRLRGSPVISARCSASFAAACSGVATPHIRLKVYMLKGSEYSSPL